MKSKYFILKPSGDTAYARASRLAMTRYAHEIQSVDPKLACELQGWVDVECEKLRPNIGLEPGELTVIMSPSKKGNVHG